MSGFPHDIATAPTWWFPYPGGAMAISADIAAAWQARGRRVVLGTYADACRLGEEPPLAPADAPAPPTRGTQLSLFATEAA